MGNSVNSYLDFAENDYMFFRQAYDSGNKGSALAALGQNICERYLKHIVSEYANPEGIVEIDEKRHILKTHSLSEPPPLISGEQKSNVGLVHPHLKGFDEPKQVSDTRLLEGLLTVLSFTLFSPGYAVRFPKLSARQRPKPMPIGR